LLQEQPSYHHELDGVAHTVTLHDDGTVVLERGESTALLVPIRLYWFAWYTFHPETTLIK
jgi:hypothetical protein